MSGAESAVWPLLHHVLDDFTEPWRDPPAEVVLLHPGLGGNGRLFRAWVPLLADRFRVLRVDARGQGFSPRPAGYVYSAETWLSDVLDVLDHLAIERVHWVGSSGGGIMGQYAAINAPERLISLSLIATTAYLQGPAGGFDAWLEPLERGDQVGFISRDTERRFGLDNPARTAWIIKELCRTPAATSAELHRWVHTVDLRQQIGRIACPTLVVTGEHDTLTGLDEARYMAEMIPNARLDIVHDQPHNVGYTHPHLIAGIVRAFLDEQGEVE
ncbi:MAG TPA: alpha/beta hydrolase [Nitrolancea sp.]|nr:alpha/beta hydrolase [Nitrolancea sp.]